MSADPLRTLLDRVWIDGCKGLQRASPEAEAAEAPVRAIVEEYLREYESAQFCAAVQIWASIQRHAGNPRWEYRLTGEVQR